MNIDRRIQILEDIEEIKNLKSRYLNACDAQDPDQAMRCFASGKITIDMGHVGFFETRESFAELYKSAGCHDYIMDLHHGSNPEIKIIDDTNAYWKIPGPSPVTKRCGNTSPGANAPIS